MGDEARDAVNMEDEDDIDFLFSSLKASKTKGPNEDYRN